MTVNALKACREVIVTIQPHYFAMKGIEEFMETMDLMRENLRHDPEIYVLITIADVRTNLYREVVEEVKIFWRSSFETVIHRNIVWLRLPAMEYR